MNLPQPEAVPDIWECDGSLRDVYIRGTKIADWEAFIGFTKSFTCEYSIDGEICLPRPAREIFSDRDHSHLLTIRIENISINCHFFVEEEIELDIDPSEIADQKAHEQVLGFVRSLSSTLGLAAMLTPENCQNSPFLTYKPDDDLWSING